MNELSRNNKDVYTSYLFTMAKYDFSIYEKRIVYRLIDLAQAEIDGMLIKDNLRKVHRQQGNREVTIPIASILRNEKDENYTIAKKAFKTLACKGLEYEDDDIWVFINIIAGPKFDKKSGSATFIVFDEIWQCLLNFTKGYRKYELNTIMAFKSVYTMRMYELMSGQKTPLTFAYENFESLCDRFKLPKTMRLHHKFEEKVLDIAKRELDESAPYSFTYKRETVPSRGRTGERVVGYTFYPVAIAENRDPNLEDVRLVAKAGRIDGAHGLLDVQVSNLLNHLGFTRDDINAPENKKLFLRAQREFGADGMVDGIERIRQSALRSKRRVNNLNGYIINGLRTMLEEKGIGIPADTSQSDPASSLQLDRPNLNDVFGDVAGKLTFK